MLNDRTEELRVRHNISFRITGIASRRLGWIAEPNGFDSTSLLALNGQLNREGHGLSRADEAAGKTGLQPLGDASRNASAPSNVRSWLAAARADVLFEATSLNVETGQPAIDHIRAALDHGAHAITANKGPIVHAYRELRDLAKTRGKKFLFESTVMDGVPIFSFSSRCPPSTCKASTASSTRRPT